MNKLAVINEDLEHLRAAHWRKRIMLMRVEQLAEAIGYTFSAIYRMETGLAQDGKHTIHPNVWKRYKLACGALHAERHGCPKGKAFNWGR